MLELQAFVDLSSTSSVAVESLRSRRQVYESLQFKHHKTLKGTYFSIKTMTESDNVHAVDIIIIIIRFQ